jgi:transcriptional regulator with XRE-family HTH domain
MKKEEQKQAQLLRKKGMSLNEIVQKVGVSKASVSLWVRDIKLSDQQKKKISAHGRSVESIEKRRINRINGTLKRHRVIIEAAKEKISTLSKHELLLIGTALYWGEGGKTNSGMARISNSDPAVIKCMMRFFREIFNVPSKKFRGHVHIFSHLNAERAEKYWSHISGIPRKQFYKTYSKPSIASKGKSDSLPYGTFQIYVCDTTIFLTIKGWIERLSELGS